jgi:hypothetical protein
MPLMMIGRFQVPMMPIKPRGRRYTQSRWPQRITGRSRSGLRRGRKMPAARRSRNRHTSARGNTSPARASRIGLPTSAWIARQISSFSSASKWRSTRTGRSRSLIGVCSQAFWAVRAAADSAAKG